MNALQDISVLVGTGCSTAIVVSANPGPIPDLQAQLKVARCSKSLQLTASNTHQHLFHLQCAQRCISPSNKRQTCVSGASMAASQLVVAAKFLSLAGLATVTVKQLNNVTPR